MHYEIQKRESSPFQALLWWVYEWDVFRTSSFPCWLLYSHHWANYCSLLPPFSLDYTTQRAGGKHRHGLLENHLQCFPVLGFLPTGSIVIMLESSSEWRNFQAHGTRLQIHQLSSIFFSTAPTQMKAETYPLLVFIHLFFSERQVPCRSLTSLGESNRHSKRKLEPAYSR